MNKHQKRMFSVIATENISINEKFYTDIPEKAAEQALPLIIKQTKKRDLNDIIDFRLIDNEPTQTVYFFIGDPTTGEIARLQFTEFVRVLADREYRRNSKQ